MMLANKIKATVPKKILTLDGGGIRGMITAKNSAVSFRVC